MCTVSMIMDHYREKWQPLVPQFPGTGTWPQQINPLQYQQIVQPAISQEEIAEFRKLLERAREYDKRNNEPDCEMSEKRDAVLRIAKALGVEISFL